MTREVVLDTETTGLDPERHRVIEIGGIELINFIPTGRTFHEYVRPDDDYMPVEALAVHGITPEFLQDKPRFRAVADPLLSFLGGAHVVAHNAEFDVGFLNAEFARVDYPPLACHVVDTARLARRRYPGSPVSLDALCARFGINTSMREKHGALVDARLLLDVYLELVGGRQPDLGLDPAPDPLAARRRPPREPRPHAPTPEELEAHARFLTEIADPIWNR